MLFHIISAIGLFVFVPIAVKFTSANPFSIGFFRLLIAVFLLFLIWHKKIQWNAFKTKKIIPLILIGTSFFFHWLTYSHSIKISGPSICVLGMATYGVQLLLYGSYFLGHQIRIENILCLVLILIGVLFVIPDWDLHNSTVIGLMLAVLSATFYSFIPILLQKTEELNIETKIFSQFFFALVGFTFTLPWASWSELSNVDWGVLLFLAIGGTFIAHTLWSKVVAVLPTTTTGIIYYIITPSVLILSHLLLGDELKTRQLIGAFIIITAALINTIVSQKKKI